MINKIRLFYNDLFKFESFPDGAMFYNKPKLRLFWPNLKHFIKYGYISYTKDIK